FDGDRGEWVGIQGTGGKVRILSLVERGGRVRSIPASGLSPAQVNMHILKNTSLKSRLHTDEAATLKRVGKQFAKHETVNHSKEEYARGDVTTNTVEGYFSVFKRGMRGTYQQCGTNHLHRYLSEFDFRYSNRAALDITDVARAEKLMQGVIGRRLTYR